MTELKLMGGMRIRTVMLKHHKGFEDTPRESPESVNLSGGSLMVFAQVETLFSPKAQTGSAGSEP